MIEALIVEGLFWSLLFGRFNYYFTIGVDY